MSKVLDIRLLAELQLSSDMTLQYLQFSNWWH